MKLTKLNQQRLALLNCVEVMSHKYEGLVCVHNNLVMQFGEVIASLNTNEKVAELFEEYCYQELDPAEYF
jgi:hypothetical protein